MNENRKTGFWRSYEALRGAGKRRDRGGGDGRWDVRLTRRSFLKLAGAQAVMLSLAGCMRPLSKIVPYVRSPEELVPGKPLYYASAVTYAGAARGVLVRSDMGRPTKIEGNPDHPDSLGSTDAVTQALIYRLYDPDRSRAVRENGAVSSRGAFAAALGSRLSLLAQRGGAGLRILSRPVISPALGDLRRRLLARFPAARWHQYSPLDAGLSRQALVNAYAREVRPVYRLQKADVILSFESDFLERGPGAVAYSRAFSGRRTGAAGMNRLYAVESNLTLTGANADNRVVCHPSEMEPFAAALLAAVETGRPAASPALSDELQNRANVIARDLLAHRGRSLAVAGFEQPVAVQMAVFRLNDLLGNTGSTVEYVPPSEEFPEDHAASLAALAADLDAGRVSDLVVMDVNPVYATPRNLGFAAALAKAEFKVHLGLYYDETARLCTWHLPMADELESWGDPRAFDGTVTVRQPLVEPLYGGLTDYELCLSLLGQRSAGYDAALREYWRRRSNRADFDAFWRDTLRTGVMAGTAFAPVAVRRAPAPPPETPGPRSWTLLFRPDPYVLDGRFAGNSWLQELPRPLTKLTWGNAALIAPVSAGERGLKDGDVVEIAASGVSVAAPVHVLPGLAPGVMTVHLGYGRTHAGTAGSAVGFDAYLLQDARSPWQTTGFTFRKKGRTQPLATTQHHGMPDGERHIMLVAGLAEYEKDPRFVQKLVSAPKRPETLYKPGEHLKGGYQWAMSIDLSRCTGCGACTIACQVENNIPVVGRKEVRRNREMHWIRVDRYFSGPPDDPGFGFQPVPCMHCEDAPCELVCPVEATSHSGEGLNEMTYNRCVGTRYCSNNCPYKVRRFNFFEYSDFEHFALPGRNPDVTVRCRGVMEKCTYCLQRINRARITAKEEGRRIRDGEIVPACAQACATRAIVFGDIRDAAAAVSKTRASPLNYGLLEDTGARPRTTYLARIRNPNPRWNNG